MRPIISQQGIDEAISNLNYQNTETLKSKLVQVIAGFYRDESSFQSLEKIEAEVLIKTLWDTGDDPAIIKAKRKNLSSIKSSVNTDLKKLYKDGKNPEGITIGRNNLFVMDAEAKDQLLRSFSSTFASDDKIDGTVDLGQITQVLNIVSKALSNLDALADSGTSPGSSRLEELRSTIEGLAKRVGLGDKQADLSPQVLRDKQGLGGVGGDAEPADDAPSVPMPLTEALNAVNAILSSPEAIANTPSPDNLSRLKDLKSLLQDLSPKLGSGLEGIASEGAPLAEVSDLGDIIEEDGEVVQEAEVVDEVLAEEEEEPEELEEAEEVEASEVLDEAGVDEVPEEAEPDEAVEEVEEDDVLEGVEVIEDVDEEKDTGRAEVEGEDRSQDMGLAIGSLGEGQYEVDEKKEKNRVLAEAFDGYLGTMERFFNQYLLIPQGEYRVGSKAPQKDEQPERRVRLGPFFMGKFPVTNALFEIFVEKTGYTTAAEKLGYATVYYGRLHKKVDEKTGLVKYTFNAAIRCETVRGACWYHPFGPGSTLSNKKNHPVVQVSLEDAMAFAAWTGKRLPTENEWEAATRTANGYVFPWGNEMKDNSCNIEESSVADTTVVDNYAEFGNDLGIVDAIGNVLEWTLDICEPPSHVKNSSTYRVVKGGSWISGNNVGLFNRFRWNAESPSNILGFRCVAD